VDFLSAPATVTEIDPPRQQTTDRQRSRIHRSIDRSMRAFCPIQLVNRSITRFDADRKKQVVLG
jgi:hypothetical protein